MQQQVKDYQSVLEWVTELAREIRPDDFGRATPCTEYTVRDLLGHLVGTARRGLATATGQSHRGIPHVFSDIPDRELALAYGADAAQLPTAWQKLPGDHVVIAPWGECSALSAVQGFTVETLVHGWDLATAIGRDREARRQVAEPALAYVTVPERLRGVMYDAPVTAQGHEGPTTRLAHYLGRSG